MLAASRTSFRRPSDPSRFPWVMDTFTGRGEGEIDLADNPYDAVSRGLGRPSLPSEIVDDPVSVHLCILTSAYLKVILKTSFFV